ncbi:uncharacterized protein LOC132867586 [Neoarius graeffei]|uniref:uncharacterized protein LOC132867586 n=2 Tax=Neoarius graeffei TaxID=443677 RepID=UPI00298C66C8|nr:uncharacterized protein LOC132867586 [Neoarius graeffei]
MNMEEPQQGQLPAGGRGRGRDGGGRRGRGRGVRMRGGGVGGRGRGVRRHHTVPDEIRATIIDHVVRNTERVKELRYQYVQRIMALEGIETPHLLVFVDEAGFNLAKCRRRGRNIIGQRATVDVPGQRGGNITMCAAISDNGVATHIASLGPYNTQRLLLYLDRLYVDLVPENERGLEAPHLSQFVIVWDNVSFHRGPLIRAWFDTHPRMRNVFLPPYSPFLNPIEEFFSAWRWRVYERHIGDQRSLLNAMDAACDDITGDQCRGWLRHSRRFFPRCIARENIRCDVDENLWPNREQRMDGLEDEEGYQERVGEDSNSD